MTLSLSTTTVNQPLHNFLCFINQFSGLWRLQLRPWSIHDSFRAFKYFYPLLYFLSKRYHSWRVKSLENVVCFAICMLLYNTRWPLERWLKKLESGSKSFHIPFGDRRVQCYEYLLSYYGDACLTAWTIFKYCLQLSKPLVWSFEAAVLLRDATSLIIEE